MRSTIKMLLFAGALLITLGAEAQGVGPGRAAAEDNAQLRTFVHRISDLHASNLNNPALTASSSVSGTIGINGLILSASMETVTGIRQGCPLLSGASCTSSVAALPYAAKLVFQFFDNGANGTLACTNTNTNPASSTRNVIRGVDQFGNSIEEPIPPMTEAARWETTYAYERVAFIQMQGCTAGGTATGDLLLVAVSTDIAMPLPVVSEASITSICRLDGPIAAGGADVAHNTRCVNAVVGSAATGLPSYVSGLVVDRRANTIDFSAISFPTSQSAVFNTGHDYVIRGRAPR
jgi:hypothetical protein